MEETEKFDAFLGITENRSKIMAVIVAMVRDFDQAEDLFQQSVLEILQSAETFDATRDFLPWASGVARNVVRRHWRKSERQPTLASQEVLDSLSELAVDEQDEDIWHAERAVLNQCLNKLPERMQKLFLLRYAHNHKAGKLAELSSFPLGSLRTTLARLRMKLRHCINSEIQESN
ncbi:sigma-70 family RNA polymerase sigma factor [Verrucomicrobiaceae bacterium 227]